jgi:hypothetical protein
VDSQDTICLVDAESIAIEAAFVASDGAIICVWRMIRAPRIRWRIM